MGELVLDGLNRRPRLLEWFEEQNGGWDSDAPQEAGPAGFEPDRGPAPRAFRESGDPGTDGAAPPPPVRMNKLEEWALKAIQGPLHPLIVAATEAPDDEEPDRGEDTPAPAPEAEGDGEDDPRGRIPPENSFLQNEPISNQLRSGDPPTRPAEPKPPENDSPHDSRRGLAKAPLPGDGAPADPPAKRAGARPGEEQVAAWQVVLPYLFGGGAAAPSVPPGLAALLAIGAAILEEDRRRREGQGKVPGFEPAKPLPKNPGYEVPEIPPPVFPGRPTEPEQVKPQPTPGVNDKPWTVLKPKSPEEAEGWDFLINLVLSESQAAGEKEKRKSNNPYGRLGDEQTRADVETVAKACLEGGRTIGMPIEKLIEHVAGGHPDGDKLQNRMSEHYLKNILPQEGRNSSVGSNYMDLALRIGDLYIYINTQTMNAAGAPIPREIDQLARAFVNGEAGFAYGFPKRYKDETDEQFFKRVKDGCTKILRDAKKLVEELDDRLDGLSGKEREEEFKKFIREKKAESERLLGKNSAPGAPGGQVPNQRPPR